MVMRAVLAIIFLAALSLAGPTPAAALKAERHEWKDALELVRGHYLVKTNTYPAVARSLLGRLAEAYVFFEDRFGPLEGKARRTMRIELYRGRHEYMDFGGGVRGASGHFDARRGACALVWRRRPDDNWPVAVHEATHHFFRRRFPLVQPPSWYSEGIACWFEGLLDDTAQQHVSRLRIRSARRAFQDGKAKLESVLRARAQVLNGKLRMDAFRPSRFYGLAWSLCHFLATDARYKDAFRRFEMRLFASRVLPSVREIHTRNLLEEECGDLKTLEAAWHEHLKALPRPKPHSVPPVYGWELSSSRPFVRWSALRRLTDGDVPADLAAAVRICAQEDPDKIVRLEACRLVATDRTVGAGPDSVATLVRALDLGDPEVKRAALEALARTDAGTAVPRLLRESKDRALALRALAAIGDERSFPILRLALHDANVPAVIRARCAAALGKDPRARESLAAAALDANNAVRLAAKTALGRLNGAGNTPDAARSPRKTGAMIAVLEDAGSTDPERMLACAILKAARTKSAIPILRRHCRGTYDDRVRLAALRALVAITGKTNGYRPAQPVGEREAAFRAWSAR